MIHVFSTTVSASAPSIESKQLWKCDATSGAITLTLPDATLCARAEFVAIKIDAGANAVTIARAGTQTILGTGGASQTSLSLASIGKSFTLVSDGSNWVITASV